MTYKIIPIDVGTLTCDKSVNVMLRHMGEIGTFRFIMWYVEDENGRGIIVDTGPYEEERFSKYHYGLTRTPEQIPENALKLHNINPEKIDTVILTHLHPDHCSNNHLFPNAKFYVQRAELQYAAAPHYNQMEGYECLEIGMCNDYYMHTKYTVLDGDETILPGIDVILTPGHSPGGQCVIIDTKGGKFAITGDTVPVFENWNGGPEHCPHIPNGIFQDIFAYHATFKKLEKTGAYILPGHDTAVFDHPCYPFE